MKKHIGNSNSPWENDLVNINRLGQYLFFLRLKRWYSQEFVQYLDNIQKIIIIKLFFLNQLISKVFEDNFKYTQLTPLSNGTNKSTFLFIY